MEIKTNKTKEGIVPLNPDSKYVDITELNNMVKSENIKTVVSLIARITQFNSENEKSGRKIPVSAKLFKKVYNMGFAEILGKKSITQFYPSMCIKLEDLENLIIELNIKSPKELFDISKDFNEKNELKIPTSYQIFKRVYKINASLLFGWSSKSKHEDFMKYEDMLLWLKNNNVSSTKDFYKKAKDFNKKKKGKLLPTNHQTFKVVYNINPGELIDYRLSKSPGVTYVNGTDLDDWLVGNNIKSLREYSEAAKEFNKNLKTGNNRIPLNQDKFKELYGSTIVDKLFELGLKNPYMDIDSFKSWLVSENVSSIEDYLLKSEKYNSRPDSCYFLPKTMATVYRVYGDFSELIGKSSIKGKIKVDLEFVKNWIQENNVKTYEDYKVKANKYNSLHPNGPVLIKNHHTFYEQYGITIGKILDKFYPKTIESTIKFHLEDLIYLDKTQLLQIGFLEKLPKDIHKEILDCPKGEPRRKLLESLPDRLKESREDIETFKDVLDRVIEEKEEIVSKEESSFENNLHSGLDLFQKTELLKPKEAVSDIFREIKSLDNFEEGDYKGPEAIDYIVSSEVQKLWNAIIRIPDPSEAMKLIEEYMLKKNGSKFFNEITGVFMSQYQGVTEMKIPEGYLFPFTPLMMQKLTAYMISTKKQFANWSETGTGKTISGVLTSRYIDSRVTLIIAVNSTIGNWTINSIKVAYPDSKVYTKKDISGNTKLDRNFHNYVVTNYEEFQNPQKFLDKWKPFLKNNKIDFVILDEVQKVKSITGNSISIRRGVIENLLQDIDLQHGRNLKNEGRIVPVLALSATPVINSLSEGLSILSLLKGTNFKPNKRTTRRSALACHFDIVRNGIRLVEELPATERLITLPVKRSFEDLSGLADNWNLLNKIDTAGCLTKIGECIRKGHLKKGTRTIIYTDLVTDVIDNITQYLRGFGFRVGEFTGRNGNLREEEMKDFISGQYDVLIASKPISTGVDGLQYVCNRMIILIPAWTYAEYHQLVGRINRKGTQYKEVEIIIPTIEYINENGKIWSLDNYRLSKIWFKKTLDDVVMNGNIPDEIITWSKAYELARKSLKEFLKNGNTKGSYEKPVLATEIKPVERKPRVRGNRNQRDYFSEFQGLNQRISTTTIENVFTKILGTKNDWVRYHELRDKAIGNIQNQAINTIARDILKSRKHKVLGDMGCGMNQLKTLLPENYEVISVDMYAADDTVKICNILDTSRIIPDGSLDIAVYSLSLWGRDWRNILDDAYRALDYDGKIVIVEPLSSSSKSIDKVKAALNERRFTNISVMTDAGNKYYYMTANK